VFTAIGQGTSTPLPVPINGKSIAVNGKPGILYIGAEYCPFCATERWAMANALARFGTFTNLKITNSDPSDVDPATRTLSFYKSTYTSDYIVFTPVETETNSRGALDSPTSAQQEIFQTHSSNGSIPFIYFDGKFLISGATYDVGVLQGKSWDQIATAMSDKSSAIAKGVIGAANSMTATICILTNDQPAKTCKLPVIQSLETQIKAQKSTTTTTNPNSSSNP
jgi:protein involved in ribonucleotide reduction